MINNRSVLAIIPARAGSKGLPAKNKREINGLPLIAWTIEKAKKSSYLDRIIVSTDDPEIASISCEHGATVPFLRPPELAGDTSSIYDVIKHLLESYREIDPVRFDYVALLEPTSPLREDDDIDRMLESLVYQESQFDSIVSIGRVTEHPSIMKRLVGDSAQPFCPDLGLSSRRQDNEPAYFPYGVAYIAKTSALLEQNTFYTERCTYFEIRRYQNYEIDDIYDFLCVEAIMKYEWKLP